MIEFLNEISKFNCDTFDSAPTWKQLRDQLNLLPENILSNPVTIELNYTGECIPGNLDMTGTEHDSLDENIPVIRCNV